MSLPKGRLWFAGSLALCAWATVAFSLAPAWADEKRQPPPTEKEITDLIRQLGADDFAARDRAQQALVRIGKPALEPLRKASRDATDVELRRRARAVMEQIDPGGTRRAELEETRADLRKAVEAAQGVDVKNWAESIANPFTELTEEGKKRLTAEGIDVARLQKMRARYLQGSYGGALAREFVNTDPDTILVVGKGFVTHGGVWSAGPVLAVEDAHFMSRVNVANLLWFVDRAGASGEVKGAPVVAADGAGVHALRQTPGILVGDFGWRPPKNFLQPPTAAEAKNDPPPTEEWAKAKKEVAAEIDKAAAADVRQVAREVANPFTALTEEGKARLKLRGVDPDRLSKLKALYLTGSFVGAASKDLVNKDPDTVLVIGKGFITHGQVYSLGPILAVEDAHFMGDVTGADVVWFADQSFPRGKTRGAPVILAPTAQHSQMRVGTRHVWHGDYGWRAPKDFPGKAKEGADN
jgi:hypothetical protein